MRNTRIVVVLAVLALFVASAVAAAAACHGPFVATGTYNPSTNVCSATIDQCQRGEAVLISKVTHDGTSCSVKYFCCKDPQ